MDSVLKMKLGRVVLIICQYKYTAKEMEKYLGSNLQEHCKKFKILIYVESESQYDINNVKETIDECTIIIATNMGGRRTDFKLTPKALENGGLHVIVTFLPNNM
jgi:preprotein translocase subunit SecA